MVYDLNPHISILDDPATKRKIAELERTFESFGRVRESPPSGEQAERERFQAESNALAETNALYAAARVAAASFLVVPLDGIKPLVDPSEASRNDRQLFDWWSVYPEANPGVLLGRIGGVFALEVEDDAAYLRLRDMAKVEHPYVEDGRDSVKGYVEVRDLGGYHVRLNPSTRPFTARMRTGWGSKFTQYVLEQNRQEKQQQPQTFWLAYSYPSVVSGMDAFDYRTRQIATGIKLLGEGDVLPWAGSILGDGIQVVAPMSRPPEVSLWLAAMIGRPRSRKVMAATREAHEAAIWRIGEDGAEQS